MTVDTGSASIHSFRSMPQVVEFDTPGCPRWLARLFDLSTLPIDGRPGIVENNDAALFQTIVPEAEKLSDDALSDAVEEIYRELFGELRHRQLQPVRIWNYLPGILSGGQQVQHRYMVFNAGRFAAYQSVFGGAEQFSSCLPTASATGTSSRHLVLHCYASNEPGTPLENGRQIPAYRYSQLYGDFPPCFTRATSVRTSHIGLPGPERVALLVGGTASIRGESSRHVGRLGRQLEETLENLSVLVAEGLASSTSQGQPLGCFLDLRVYHPRRKDRPTIRQVVKHHFPQLATLEFVHADLCRPELLVEIEGTAAPPTDRGAATSHRQ